VFNNVMIAALYALDTYSDLIHRIAIVDIGLCVSYLLIVDIHHGNGTEQILKRYNHPEKIMFWSSHIYFNVALRIAFPLGRTP
jgi:histone deacetylase domain